jgi:hypothetical protein
VPPPSTATGWCWPPAARTSSSRWRPSWVATSAALYAVSQPQHVDVADVMIRPVA